MKFDCVIGNPPYNKNMIKNPPKGNHGGYPHLMFIEQTMKYSDLGSFVIPAGFMTLRSLQKFRQHIFDNYYIRNITVKDNSDRNIFDVAVQHIAILDIQKEPCKTTYNNSFEVELSRNDYWPMYRKEEDVRILKDHKEMSVPAITTTKTEPNAPFISYAILDPNMVFTSLRLNETKPTVKYPAYILFNSMEQATVNYEYMQTPEYKHCLSMVKSINKIQPSFIEDLGLKNTFPIDRQGLFDEV